MTLKSKLKHPRVSLSFLVVVLLSLPTAVVVAGDSRLKAHELINHMSRAARQSNYDGIFIYKRGRHMETMRLIHKVDENGEVERLVSLTGPAREVIRNKKSVTCIFPDDNAVMVEKSRSQKLFSNQLPESIEKVSELYEFSVLGQDRVAGRDTWVVLILPKDGFRYGYQLWVDKGHYLLLKSELNDVSGEVLEQIIFTKIDVLDTIPDEMLKPSMTDSGYKWYTNTDLNHEAETTASQWRVEWMPKGFSLSNYEKGDTASSKNALDHMVYTDGMAMVSIFIEKIKNQTDFVPGALKMGAVNTYARLSNGYQVTAVGEVPQATVQRMAISVVAK